MESHRAELEKLSEKDPEFYKFLEEQDADLLEFNESDYEIDEAASDEEHKVEEDVQEEEVKIGKHTVNVRLDREDRKIVNQELADLLDNVLSSSSEKRAVLREAIGIAIQLFQTCTAKVGVKIENIDYVVSSNEVFDSIVRTCLKHMGRCLLFLMNPVASKQTKSAAAKKNTGNSFKFWKKYRGMAKLYLQTLIRFMAEMSEQEALIACIRSTTDLTDLLVHFPKTCRVFIKFMVKIWSRKTIDERCVAFLALNRLCRSDPRQFTAIYKKCYVAYVSASRHVSTNAWKNLLFMQKSFGELTYLHPETAYQLAFAYIRQFAIHLRNATIAKRKDLIKTVYNWQYVLGLYLWASVLVRGRKHKGAAEGVEWINELLYPVIQITIGLIGVFSAQRYLPLRLHCVRILLQLQVNCDVFIPTFSLAADCLNDLSKIDEKKPSQTKVLEKSTEIRNLIRLTSEMLEDVSYRRRAAKEVFGILFDSVQVIKDDPAFFEIYIPVKVTLKNFLRTCKNVEHKKLFKEFEKTIS